MGIHQVAAPRIAIYSQDGFGLGHMRRTSSIAHQVFKIRNDSCILTISDSELGQFFNISPHQDYVKLPSIVKDGPGDWRATHLPMSSKDIFEIRKQLIRSALVSFAPQIFLVDHMPHGAMGELLPGLRALREAGIPTRVVLGIRDILDAPDVIEQRWQEEGAYSAIEEFYSRVLVYGMRGIYDVTEKYHFPERITQLTRYCGYVCAGDPSDNAGRIRTRSLAGAPADTRLIVAMAGGGADAYPMMKAIISAFREVQKARRCVLVMITGPFLPAEESADLRVRARKLPIRILKSVSDTVSYVAAADLVISMAGYNSSVEILRMKKPAILIPRHGPSAEQRTRASLFAGRRWVDSMDLEDATPELLAQKMILQMKIHPNITPYNRPDLLGGAVAANQILALLSARKEQEPVEDL